MSYPFARLLTFPLLRRRIHRLTGAELIPRSVPFIAVANHSGWLDSAYLVATLSAFTDKKIYLIASSRKYRWFGGLPIDRSDPSGVLATCAAKLARGHPIIIFPEGTSNPQAVLRRGKTGAARLALQTQASILPIGILGTRQPNALTSLLHFFCFWRPITLTVGKPLTPGGASVGELTHDIMVAISHLSGKPLADA